MCLGQCTNCGEFGDCDCGRSVVTEKVIAFIYQYPVGDYCGVVGFVLSCRGEIVEYEQKMLGRDLDDWLITKSPPKSTPGVWVWEGVCENCANKSILEDWEPRLRGEWRKPTPEELQSLVPEEKENSLVEEKEI